MNLSDLPLKVASITQPLLITGDDVFLRQDAAEIYLSHWQSLGFKSYRLEVNSANDWLELQLLINQKSIFKEQKVILVNFKQNSFTKQHDDYFYGKFKMLNPDIKVALVTNKLSATTKQTFAVMTKITIWPKFDIFAWANNQAKYLGLNIDRSMLNKIISMSDYQPIAIKNSLRMFIDNPASLIAHDQIQSDCWQVLATALAGNTKALIKLLAKAEDNSSWYMSIFNACVYHLQNLVKIADFVLAGVNIEQACQKATNWPKQQQLYAATYRRGNNLSWHKLLQEVLLIEVQLKGADVHSPIKHQLENILIRISYD